MKSKLVLTLAAILVATTAYAQYTNCSIVVINGKPCQVCCNKWGICQTTCN